MVTNLYHILKRIKALVTWVYVITCIRKSVTVSKLCEASLCLPQIYRPNSTYDHHHSSFQCRSTGNISALSLYQLSMNYNTSWDAGNVSMKVFSVYYRFTMHWHLTTITVYGCLWLSTCSTPLSLSTLVVFHCRWRQRVIVQCKPQEDNAHAEWRVPGITLCLQWQCTSVATSQPAGITVTSQGASTSTSSHWQPCWHCRWAQPT